MNEISNRTALPYSSICYLQCVWPDQSITRASGVIVGVNDVLTADHAIFDAARGGYATSIMIVPGADTSPSLLAPFGTYTDVAVIFSRNGNWDTDGDGLLTSQESQSDLALLGLRTPIGNNTGWSAVSSFEGTFDGTIDGYPARGTGLMEEQVSAQSSASWSVYDVQASLGPGASGGPLLRTDAGGVSVVGVLSSGDAQLTHTTYAGLFGSNWTWLQDSLRADDVVMQASGVPASGNFPGAAAGVITYLGSTSSDAFRSTGLNETFLGRGGSDSVIFAGTRADYHLSHGSGSNIVVLDSVAGRDGNDTLAGPQHAMFTDLNVNLQIGNDSRAINSLDLKLLESLYVAFFNRIPEADGLDYWINQVHAGRSVAQVADNFYAAALQYPQQTGYTSAMTSADFVNLVYRNVLGRTDGADAGGLQYWTDQLAHGTTRGYLVDRILGSAMSFKGDATWGWVADLLDNKAYVAQKFAVEMGLNYNTPQESITHGMQIAAAVTPTSTAEAVALIGVADTFSTLG